MTKVVINKKIGGNYRLSEKAMFKYAELKGMQLFKENESWFTKAPEERNELYDGIFCQDFIKRDDPCLVQMVEELGKEANGENCVLKIVEVPDDVKWTVECEEDGPEYIEEVHRIWF